MHFVKFMCVLTWLWSMKVQYTLAAFGMHIVWLLEPKRQCYSGNFVQIIMLRKKIWVEVVRSGCVTNSTFCRCRTEESCHLWHTNPWGGRVIQLPTSWLEEFPMLPVCFWCWGGPHQDCVKLCVTQAAFFYGDCSYIAVLINDHAYLETLRKWRASTSCKIHM